MTAPNWKSDFYDSKLDFVSELGKGVIELLAPKRGETILDLGCGTGDLAHEISRSGASVIGIDLSAGMIGAARKKYPEIDFRVGDAEDFALERKVDAVFSNAALHWMKRPERVISRVWDALKPGGRFVAEFGGKGNVETPVSAIIRVLGRDYGIDAAGLSPWYFPSIGEYAGLLERHGFHVAYAVHFDRPTRMKDGEEGLKLWIRGFADFFFRRADGSGKRSRDREGRSRNAGRSVPGRGLAHRLQAASGDGREAEINRIGMPLSAGKAAFLRGRRATAGRMCYSSR